MASTRTSLFAVPFDIRIGVLIASIGIVLAEGAIAQTCNGAARSETPDIDFEIHADGTATHKRSGLMWKRCMEGSFWSGSECANGYITYTWQEALQRAAVSNAAGGYAGYVDWRVPSVKELQSIVEDRCQPSANMTVFPEIAYPSGLWSASATHPEFARAVSFAHGATYSQLKSSVFALRLVRDAR